MEDGVDYVPADTNVIFGHQIASIAGAAAINGPIQASVFGWVPVLLWILLGGVFFGAVQDFAAMYASVKNKGRTIGYIIESYIGKTGKKLFLLLCWLFSILVVAAFVDIVAGTFNGFQTAADGTVTAVQANGSVATTSMLFVVEAVALGFLLHYGKCGKWLNTAITLVMLVLAIALGLQFPLYIDLNTWHILVFVYVLIASVAPIWALLQPRDYLNSYLLIAMIVAAVIGVFAARPEINLPAFSGFTVNGQTLFPFLFVTIACGAVSGFHSLVSSGTASKQIKNEKSMLPVSFGAMLMESMLAVIALIAVASFSSSAETAALGYTTPAQIFAGGVAGFLAVMGLPQNVVFTLINLAVSAFALTSLDSVARVGRLSFQELFLDESIRDEDYLRVSIDEALDYNPMKIAGFVKEKPFFVNDELALIYPRSAISDAQVELYSANMYFLAKDHVKTFNDMTKILSDMNADKSGLFDVAADAERARSLTVIVNVFAFGFIILISLIALTNVFNTVSTNIFLRRRELAMFKSIGMTRGGFNKMMKL